MFECLPLARSQIPMYMKDGMRNQIQSYYTHDNTIGKYWNRVQMMVSNSESAENNEFTIRVAAS